MPRLMFMPMQRACRRPPHHRWNLEYHCTDRGFYHQHFWIASNVRTHQKFMRNKPTFDRLQLSILSTFRGLHNVLFAKLPLTLCGKAGQQQGLVKYMVFALKKMSLGCNYDAKPAKHSTYQLNHSWSAIHVVQRQITCIGRSGSTGEYRVSCLIFVIG